MHTHLGLLPVKLRWSGLTQAETRWRSSSFLPPKGGQAGPGLGASLLLKLGWLALACLLRVCVGLLPGLVQGLTSRV